MFTEVGNWKGSQTIKPLNIEISYSCVVATTVMHLTQTSAQSRLTLKCLSSHSKICRDAGYRVQHLTTVRAPSCWGGNQQPQCCVTIIVQQLADLAETSILRSRAVMQWHALLASSCDQDTPGPVSLTPNSPPLLHGVRKRPKHHNPNHQVLKELTLILEST